MNMIPSPLSLDLTNTRAFKTWLYQLWQSTGGTTTTATEDIDLYLATPAIDSISGSQLDQVLLTQIRDELSEINKKLDEIQINERTVLEDVNRKFDDVIILLGASL
jgi:hypothetical protein